MTRSTSRLLAMAALIVVSGCDCLMDKISEKVGEQVAEEVMEHATGKEVDMEEGRVVIQGEDGEKVVMEKLGEDGMKGVVVGKDGKTIHYESGKEGMRIEGKDGTAVIGGKTVPEEFPLPVPEGATIGSSMASDKGEGKREFMVAMNVQGGKLEELDAFYKKALEDAGYEVKRTSMDWGAQKTVTLKGKKDGSTADAMLALVPNKPGVTIMLTVKEK